MEKTYPITNEDFRAGLYVELECCMCGNSQTLAADTEEELTALIEDSGWENLESDKYQVQGWWCGCDYIDNDD